MSEYVSVAKASDFYEVAGRVRRYIIDGVEVGVTYWDGRFHAFTNRCTHAGFPLHFGGLTKQGELICMSHGAMFDPATGVAIQGPNNLPTEDPLTIHDIRVVDDDLQVSLRPPLPRSI